METWRMAGRMDYMLRVAVADMPDFDRFYKRLTDAVPIKNVTSFIFTNRDEGRAGPRPGRRQGRAADSETGWRDIG